MFSLAAGGVVGYAIAQRTATREIARLRQEYQRGLARERELRAQLHDALAQRAALAQESQRLQEQVAERLRRLEEAAAQLTLPEQSESE
jgi:predicted  nucleic acid-binding Zn-ribbon protein